MDSDLQKIDPRRIDLVLPELMAELKLKSRCEDSTGVIGISTGFSDLDALRTGLRPGSLCVIAGRPSMGESTFALGIASHVAMGLKLPVVVFSMNMPALQVAQRLVGSTGKVDQYRLQTGRLEDIDWVNTNKAFEKLKNAELFIDGTPGLTVDQICSRTLDTFAQHGRLGLVVVDNLQCINPVISGKGSSQHWNSVMSSLKNLASELNTPIVLLSRLTRSLENRKNKRPRFSDLPACEIGQFADLLLFIYRDEVYDKDTPKPGTAEIIIDRNRFGPSGAIRLNFAGSFGCFYDFTA